ncbi:hypothetical protein N510_001880 [Firmicutes bacterium ASF500]|nr:hypothetical protein N510_001880 [Firmicutes bacterium ASF500]
MFYDRFVELCKAKGMSPAAVAREIGLSNSSTTTWKRGSLPKGDTLQKVADYFGVSVDYLIGKETEKTIGFLISSNIKLFREKLGVSQKILAEYIGVPVERIQDIEDGKALPTIGELERISSGLWTTPEDILSIQHIFNESFIREKFLEIVLDKYGYVCFSFSTGGKSIYAVSSEEKTYEIEKSTFDSFIESVDDYINFSITQLLKKAVRVIPRYRTETAPQSPPVPQEGTDTTPPPEGAEGPQEGE